jgi:hypothetical protein
VKILVAIPHFHNPAGTGAYGSTGPESARRAEALSSAIAGLHQTFGPRQAFLYCLHEHIPGRGNARLARVNTGCAAEVLDIAICTVSDRHVIDQLSVPRGLFHHQPVQADPMHIGFACHQVFKSHIGKYDFYCYLEDDLVLSDPLFLSKLRWFTKTFGEEALLQPHRFETSTTEPIHKLYIDGPVKPDFTAQWQNVEDQRELRSEFLGEPLAFERWPNPHSGCFFLSAAQMEKWAASSFFLDGDCSFAGPLESAASLGIMKTFRIYKPSFANAGFLELRHFHNRYLGISVKTF